MTSVLTLLLNLVVFLIFYLLSKPDWNFDFIWIGLFLVELYLVSVGLALILCAFYPKFRDIQHIWEVFVQLGFWATPIIYPISKVPTKYHAFIFLNPVARIIQGARQATIGSEGNFIGLSNHLYVLLSSILLMGLGTIVFNRMSPSFAEDL